MTSKKTNTGAPEDPENTPDKPAVSGLCADPEPPIEEVWRRYRQTASDKLRAILVNHYLPLIRSIVRGMDIGWFPPTFDEEDAVSAGHLALLEAIETFNLERKVKFSTYLSRCVRNRVVSELRRMDWMSRTARSRAVKLAQVHEALTKEYCRPPTEEEVCEHLGVATEQYKKLYNNAEPVRFLSINLNGSGADSSKAVCDIDIIQDKQQEDPLAELQKQDLKLFITKGLTPPERQIIILRYYEEMTIKEIGLTLDLSDQQVRRIRRAAIDRLRKTMRQRELL